MDQLYIYCDHVLALHPRQQLLPIDGLALGKFRDLVLSWAGFSSYLKRTEGITMSKSHDYDGYPFEDFYQFTFPTSDKNLINPSPGLRVTFASTYDQDFDYNALARKSNVTAYRSGPSGKPEETHFKVVSAALHRREGDVEVWFKKELNRLLTIICKAKRQTTSIGEWSKSGIWMLVVCPKRDCRSGDPAIFDSNRISRLSENGLSLEDLQKKLKCRRCGSPAARLVAA